ncbi:methyl-accepting chemotaxis protein [Paenibacillus sp. PK3_47]|uniref:methyl-accepting chemotaxis protein n=1 Tax=Paenibacillus sp. PK3_47 TaxID=2072642 RepID=UPI00201D9C43|nr:methyl-accepting chemotaxis protein [Paenibacillus sp. PK3_47]UQZ33252.1 methyl-accepting chemotaxis protein [Paenibacillus sp. PK3_47]
MRKVKQAFTKLSNVSLQIKLPALITLLVIASVLLLSVSVYRMGSGLLLKKSKDEITANADRIGEGLWTAAQLQMQSSYLISSEELFRVMLELRESGTMSDDEFFSGENPYLNAANQKLANFLKNTQGSQSLTLLDTNGIIVAGSNPETVGDSRADREYFQKALLGQPFISDAITSASTGKLIVAFSQPVKDMNGKIIGVYSTNMDSSFFTDKLGRISINGQGQIEILSRSGIVLYNSRDETKIGVKPEGIESLLEMKPENDIITGEADLGTQYLRYNKIPGSDWSVSVIDSYKDIKMPIYSMLKQIVLLAVAAVVIATFIGLLISRSITRPIVKLSRLFTQLASGDLKVTADGDYTSEFKELAGSFNTMVQHNRALITNMNASITVLNASTRELDNSSSQTARSISETTTTTAEIALAMESQANDTGTMVEKFFSFGGKIVSMNDKAQSVKERADEIVTVFHDSSRVIEELARVSENNDAEVRKISDITRRLQESSDSIGRITGAINNIANQTNLLALNASIEAARAGEHGRGFAVVAAEIRKLAEQSAAQSNEINGIIGQNMAFVEENYQSVQQIRDISQLQDEYVEKTKHAFEAIHHNVLDITGQINSMAGDISLMQQDKDEMLESSQNLSASGEEVSASVEEVTATIQEQSYMVQQLSEMVRTIDRLSGDLAEAASRFKTE